MNRTAKYWDVSWSPVVGCSHSSAGCDSCWAENLASTRLAHLPEYAGLTRDGHWTGEVRTLPDRLSDPLRWRKGRIVFVCIMSDLFHPAVSNDFIAAVFGVMAACPQHQFLVCTKRAERMKKWFDWEAERSHGKRSCVITAAGFMEHSSDLFYNAEYGPWPLDNVYLGVTAENQATADKRIPLLLQTPAARRLVSVEPMLEGIDLDRYLHRGAICECNPRTSSNDRCGDGWIRCNAGTRWIDAVIVGGESGPGARACNVEWIRSIVRQCKSASVPCFVKQLGAKPILEGPPAVVDQSPESILRHGEYDPDPIEYSFRSRSGADPSEWPEELRVRELGWRRA